MQRLLWLIASGRYQAMQDRNVPAMRTKTLRILIVDDSALVRSALRELLESDPDIHVVGEAEHGRQALLLAAELQPDVITMDVRMPIMDGLETTEQLMAYNPTPVLAITSLYSRDDVDVSFKMLGAGALEVMEKPDISSEDAMERARRELIRRVKLLARVRVVTHLRGRRRPEPATPDEDAATWRVKRTRKPSETAPAPAAYKPEPRPAREAKLVVPAQGGGEDVVAVPLAPDASDLLTQQGVIAPPRPVRRLRVTFPLVIIGASTGGPRIVQQILKGLPATFGAAVVVVQHIAEGFSEGMVEWLSETSGLPVRLAQEGDQVAMGLVLVAPDGYHLYIKDGGMVHLNDQPVLQRPSVDIAMQTAANVFGSQTIGVLLTGMGRDGAIGMQAIQRAGGYTVAQDEASCSIYGMPRAAVELRAAEEVHPPDGIVQVLRKRVGSG